MTLAMDKLAWQGADRPAVRHVAIIMDGNGRWAAERGAKSDGGKDERRGHAHANFRFLADCPLAVLVRERSGSCHAVDLAEVPPKRRLRR